MKIMRKNKAFLAAFLLMCAAFLTGCGAKSDETVETEADTAAAVSDSAAAVSSRQEGDAESFTLMVYICGADLESVYGNATTDINEMLYADAGENLNIIVQTGGTSEWQNTVISADSVQRYSVSSDGIELLDDIGQVQVTTTEAVGDFISFCMEEKPADRYGIIFWDHGGGTMGGYGSDENYDDASMNISQLAEGLKEGGCHFDFIGFDCCLMATVENAEAVSPYADYMIASEETEPGTGWYYTNFLSEIEQDPNISVEDLGTTIVTDYVDEENTYLDDGVTLSVVDLSQMSVILENLYTYLSNSREFIQNGGFTELATARSSARSYGLDDFDQIDAIDYIEQTDVEGAEELKNALESAVIVNGGNIAGSNGLAMYYPYMYLNKYDLVTDCFDSIGFDSSLYAPFFDDFITIVAGGQVDGGNSNPFSAGTTDVVDYSDSDWYDTDIADQYEDSYSYVDTSSLEITEKGDGYVLQLSGEDWDIISQIELQVYADDGEGYLALGSDNLYDVDEDGDLIVDYDYNWIYLNDSIVSYYVQEISEHTDGNYYTLGYIPAVLNDSTDIDIWLLWDNSTGDVTIEGYQLENEDSTVSQRGYLSFEDGDVIDFYFDYYTYDGDYENSYLLENNSITYSSEVGLEVSYQDIGDVNTEICFWLSDIYGNEYWTEPLDFIINDGE